MASLIQTTSSTMIVIVLDGNRCHSWSTCFLTIELVNYIIQNNTKVAPETLVIRISIIITGRNEVVAKVMFLHVCVILFTGGSLGRENPPLGRENPPGRESPPRTRQTPPDQADTPGPGKHPPDQADHPLGPGRLPLEADSRIRSTSGRYASYWNAFLFTFCVYSSFCGADRIKFSRVNRTITGLFLSDSDAHSDVDNKDIFTLIPRII